MVIFCIFYLSLLLFHCLILYLVLWGVSLKQYCATKDVNACQNVRAFECVLPY